MTDPRSPEIGGIDHDAERRSPSGMPRWVKVIGLVVLVVALVLGAVLLLGGGEHGPARHTSAGSTGGIASATALTTAAPTSG